MIIGAVLLVAALALFFYNRRQEEQAEETVEAVMPRLLEAIAAEAGKSKTQTEIAVWVEEAESADTEPADAEEAEPEEDGIVVDGSVYIGYLSIPALELELPIQASWSLAKLKISPCRYYGSVGTEDMVIAAHNYSRHFGRISGLKIGDRVIFTDANGVQTEYEVAEVSTLEATAIKEMTSSGYELTLFTCTYGGKSRVTVRCAQVDED